MWENGYPLLAHSASPLATKLIYSVVAASEEPKQQNQHLHTFVVDRAQSLSRNFPGSYCQVGTSEASCLADWETTSCQPPARDSYCGISITLTMTSLKDLAGVL